MAYPRLRRSRAHKSARRTSGNLTLNSTTWANVDTGLDLVINECQVGDQILYGLSALVGSEAVTLAFDVATIVSAAPLNSFAKRGAVEASPGYRIPGWHKDNGKTFADGVSGNAPLYTVVAGDIVSGSVTLRLRYATGTAANVTLYASADYPLDVWAMNIGPVQT